MNTELLQVRMTHSLGLKMLQARLNRTHRLGEFQLAEVVAKCDHLGAITAFGRNKQSHEKPINEQAWALTVPALINACRVSFSALSLRRASMSE